MLISTNSGLYSARPNDLRVPMAEAMDFFGRMGFEAVDVNFAATIYDEPEKHEPILDGDWQQSLDAVLAAIRCHTTLRAAPSPCDMALFLADKLAWDQPGEPPFRSVIEDGLSVSLELASLRYIEYVLDHGMILMPHRWLMEALAWLRARAGSPEADGGAR